MPEYLYTIEDAVTSVDGIVLRPGVPPERISDEVLEATQQGTVIELRMPNGECQRTEISDYQVHFPLPLCDPSELSKLPIVFVIGSKACTEPITVGTEVWLAD